MAKGPLLLFVDEGTDWLVEIRNRLVASGSYHVLAVETGAQALTTLEDHKVALLLTDNAMASVQDRRFGMSLRRDHAALPRVLFAERPELELAIALRNGDRIDGALPKPCDPGVVVSLVRRVVGDATMRVSTKRATLPTKPDGESGEEEDSRERETQPDLPSVSGSGDH